MSMRIVRVLLEEVDDKNKQQMMKLLGLPGEELKNVPYVGHYGFHSVPPKGAHGFLLQHGGGPSGGRDLNAVFGIEHPEHRPKSKDEGYAALYDNHGNTVSIVEKEIRITHAKKRVDKVGNCTYTYSESGLAIEGGRITHDGRNIGKDHKHGQVQPGGGVTGDPEA